MLQKKEVDVKRVKQGKQGTEPMIAGIDIAKHRHVARLYQAGSVRSPVHSFSNSLEGFTSFTRWLKEKMEEKGYQRVIIGMESTRHYWKPLASYLDGISWVTLVQVNPSHVKKAKEIYDGSPLKTDNKDAGVIALLTKMGRTQHLILPRGVYAELRIDSRIRDQKIVELGVRRNILHSLIDAVFPEYQKIFKKLESKSSLSLLKKYPTPRAMTKAGLFRISKVLNKASHGKEGRKRAGELLEAANATIGIKEGEPSYTAAIKDTVEGIFRILEEIKEVEEKLKNHLQEVPYAEYLLSMQGIGSVTLSIILGETGNLHHYRKAEEITKLAGLNLYEISSGKYRGKKRISKRGRPLLRKTLFFVALRMVKTGGIFREDYLHLTEDNHMEKMKALTALSRKLVRVIVALVRDEAYYHKKDKDQKMAKAA